MEEIKINKKERAYIRFRKALLKKSKSEEYQDAILEWKFVNYDEVCDDDKCICGVKIYKRYHFIQIASKKTIIVGKDCVEKFMEDIELSKVFKTINKILNNKKHTLDTKIVFAYANNMITLKQYNFLQQMINFQHPIYRYPSIKQQKYRDLLYERVRNKFKNRTNAQSIKYINEYIVPKEN